MLAAVEKLVQPWNSHWRFEWPILAINLLQKRNRLQFLFVVKTIALKQQTSKFYPPIHGTVASYHISQQPVVWLSPRPLRGA